MISSLIRTIIGGIMRTAAATLFVIWSALSGSPASASVHVSFVDPERYVDARSFGAARIGADKSVLRGIRRHLEYLAEHRLPPNLTLNVEVLDIDLAGFRKLGRAGGDALRVLTEATWPRITLRYVLIESGNEVLSGEETLADVTYLQHGGRYGSDTLRHEKRLLDDWFTSRIVERRPAR
jgi:hypothetical protein